MSETIYAVNKENFIYRHLYLDDNSDPLDLSNYTSVIKVAKYYGSTSVTIPGVVSSPTTGMVSYEALASIWSNMLPGAYVYSRYLYDASNNVVAVVNGDLILIPAV